MTTTVMLCRWHHGWSEVSLPFGISQHGRREAMLSLGAQQTIEEVVRLAHAELSGLFAKHREQMTVEHRPTDLSETPYIGYQPSDRVQADNYNGNGVLMPVISMTVTEDEHGELAFLPKIGDVILGAEELQEDLLRNLMMNRGRPRPSA